MVSRNETKLRANIGMAQFIAVCPSLETQHSFRLFVLACSAYLQTRYSNFIPILAFLSG